METLQNKTEIFETSQPTAPLSLRILTLVVVITIIYFAKMILLPILVAAFIALFASPMVRSLEDFRIPKPLASLLLEAALIIGVIYIFSLLFEPAMRWLEAAPLIGDRLADGIRQVSASFGVARNSAAGDASSAIEQAMDSTMVSLASMFAQTTVLLIVQGFAVIIMIYFFLVYGDDLMRNIVKAQQTFSDKKLTVIMFQVIRDDVSMYILWVSLINVALGICTAVALSLAGVQDAFLWGALATILNYAPYVGPLVLIGILTAVGFAEHESLLGIAKAPAIFFVLNLIEGQFVTPTVLGRRFNINPLLVVLWMFIWGWLWGVGGMLLAIPLLMCIKLALHHLRLIGNWVEIFNGCTHEEANPNCKKLGFLAKFTKARTETDSTS
ncbi:MAG: AI-2E family transporter [Cellvibrionaceae bacterium]|nr:AI-2E family transporter [Cellvibrionaceae bacterium]